MLSPKSFIVLPLIPKSVIHFKLISVYGVCVHIQLSHHHLLKRLFFSHLIVMTPLLKICHNNFVWDLTKILFCCLLCTSEMGFSLLLGGREWARIAFLVLQSRIKLFLVFFCKVDLFIYLSCTFWVAPFLFLFTTCIWTFSVLCPFGLYAMTWSLLPTLSLWWDFVLKRSFGLLVLRVYRARTVPLALTYMTLESASIYLSMKSAAVLRLAPKPSTEHLPSPVRHLSSVLQLRKPSCLPTRLFSQVFAQYRS